MSPSVPVKSTVRRRPVGRLSALVRVGVVGSAAVLLAACGGQSSTSSTTSSAAPAASSVAVSSAATSSAPASSAAGSSAAESSAMGSTSAESSASTPSSATAGGGSAAATSIVPAPTGDALTTVLDAKCAAFGQSLEASTYGLSGVKQIEDSRGVCRWEATGLSQPAVLQVDPRVANSAQTDQQDRERFCADVTEAGASNPQSNRAKRIAEQVRSQLYYYPAGTDDGVATLTTYRQGASGADGGISLGCDQTYAYEVRIYTTAPLTANLSGSSLVATHRAS